MSLVWPDGRETYPEEYALTKRESVRVTTAKRIIDDVLTEFVGTDEAGNIAYVISPESAEAIRAALSRKWKTYTSLFKLARRVLSGDWYTLVLSTNEKVLDEAGPGYLAMYLITRQSYEKGQIESVVKEPVNKEPGATPLSSANNAAEMREQLHLPAGSQFLYSAEWHTLILLDKLADSIEAGTIEQVSIPKWRIKSNPLTMSLINVEKRSRSPGRYDKNTSTITYQAGDNVKIVVPTDKDGVIALNDPNAAKMLDLLQVMAYETKYSDTMVSIPMREFMRIRGLKDAKHAKEQALKAIEALDALQFSYYTSKGDLDRFSLSQRRSKVDGRVIRFRFTQDYFSYIRQEKASIEYPKEMQSLPMRGSAYFFARRIIEQKRRNIGRASDIENRVSVASLLKCSRLPMPEDVPRGHIKKRITDPFDEALEAIVSSGIISGYTYQHTGGGELSAAELDAMWTDYDLFTSLTVAVEWGSNAPDYSRIAERRKAHQAAALAAAPPKRKRGRPRKKNL